MAYKQIKTGQYLVSSQEDLQAAATHFYRSEHHIKLIDSFEASLHQNQIQCGRLEDGEAQCYPSIVGFAFSSRICYHVEQVFHFCQEDIDSLAGLFDK